MDRVGSGTDIHRLSPGRPLILGGVTIESDFGAEGHSDADVLTHAITDALLGALALGDIGSHFPNTDDRWKNAESFVFLKYAVGEAAQMRFVIANIDSTVHLERPKLRPHIDEIRRSLASAIGIDVSCISVKAKTGEGIGEVGEGRAIRAETVVLLKKV